MQQSNGIQEDAQIIQVVAHAKPKSASTHHAQIAPALGDGNEQLRAKPQQSRHVIRVIRDINRQPTAANLLRAPSSSKQNPTNLAVSSDRHQRSEQAVHRSHTMKQRQQHSTREQIHAAEELVEDTDMSDAIRSLHSKVEPSHDCKTSMEREQRPISGLPESPVPTHNQHEQLGETLAE
ncbi:hypothetical protein ACLOJK_029223 [Asimina triloba]